MTRLQLLTMKTPILKLTVPETERGTRLDIFCSHRVEGRSRSHFTKLAASGHIIIDGKEAKPSHKVKPGEVVELELVSPPPVEAIAEAIPLDIVYEDDYLLIVNKPAGMVCHPAAGNYSGTLVNGLLYYFSQLKEFSDKIRPGLVHRLDKDTSGLLVVAKDEGTLRELQLKLQNRKIKRQYFALVWGKMPQPEGIIDLPMGRSESDRKKMKVFGTKSREATTNYEVLKSYPIAELVRLKLQTGRTHQIRVHLAYFGNPVVGDPTYGGRARALTKLSGPKRQLAMAVLRTIDRQALHAWNLGFDHPITGESINLTCEPPADFQKTVELLEASAS
jgi:23S rRNA pseudouridine1911/1915/1917 synthase